MIIDALRGLGAVLCNAIYPLIAILYDLFMKVSRVELLTSDYIQPIYQRVTMILTIVMVFYVTFEMVKFVVEPDNFSNKDKGAPKIVLRMVLVVILIAFVPRIFGIAYQVQNKIFDTQIFSKVILGTSETKTDQLGKNLSRNIFNMFYYVDEESFTTKELEKEDNCDKMPCKQLVAINLGKLQQDGRLPLLSSGLSSKGDYIEPTTGEKVKKYYIEFNWLFAVAVGGFIAYILLLYCIDVGVRVVQLLYLQIIAPIPIMGYLSPKKDGIFEKWTKQCVTTYLDLFIRTGIIYFILLICEILGKGFMDGKFDSETLGGTSVFIVLVMGLLLFAHKMPKMLGELFPKMGAAAGNFGLKAGERVAPEAARIAGAALGSTRVVGGMLGRGIKTAQRNINNGHNIFTKRGREAIANSREKRKNAIAEYKTARNELRNTRRAYNRTTSKTDTGEKAKFEKAQDTFNQKRNEVADLKNKQYRSVAGSALVGGIQGGWQGATTGAKATKLEDIGKQVKAGYKKNEDSISAYEKYMNNGGSGGIEGWVDRKITAVESSLGVPTRASKIEQEIKNYDDQIKEQKQIAAVEASVIQSSDKATEANVKKIKDDKLPQKVEIDTPEKIALADALASDIGLTRADIQDKELNEIYQIIQAKATRKKQDADQLSKEAGNDPTKIAAAEAAQQEALNAQQNVEKSTKKMGEYANTIILRDKQRNSKKDYESGAVIAINTALQRLKDASSQPETISKLRELWTNQGKTSDEIETYIRYINDPETIDKFKDLDDIGKALSTVSATRESDTKEIENAKNRVASGAYKAEITANAELNNNGNSGKK